MTENTMIRWEQDGDGVVVLTFDDPAQAANTMNSRYRESFASVLDRLEAETESVAGVVLASAKPTFLAGGDLGELHGLGPGDAAKALAMTAGTKAQLRRLETFGRPVAAAINGAALGGGLELCLAAHHRVALRGPRVQVGFPEVTLGLCPGAGGIARSVRLLGIQSALTELLLAGQRLRPDEALELGIIDANVDAPGDLIPAAKAWVLANPDARQPWDREGYAIPGGTPSDPTLAEMLPMFAANLSKQLKGAPYPAPKAILSAAVEGAQVDFEGAQLIEGRYFAQLATGQTAKNMTQAFFFDLQRVNGEESPALDANVGLPTKAVVIGAGMMGAAIAFVCAESGLEVVLLDREKDVAERGKEYSERLLEKAIGRGRKTAAEAAEVLGRITPEAEFSSAAGADLVIEAVFEDPGLKSELLGRIEEHVAPASLLGTNTSSLPITDLAESVSRPEDFVGLHFFSPVDKMPLLEIVRGERTSDLTVARARSVARLLRKTPIVVNDSRGFFTSRVIGTFIDEGISMLTEGIPAASIEQASRQAGYPAPVLQLADELNLGLIRRIRREAVVAAEAAGESWDPHPAETVIARMLDEFGREGKLSGAGFYDYSEGRRQKLWDGLGAAFGTAETPPSLGDLKERMLFVESLEAIKCLEEGVIGSVAEANVGSILGIGFPGWTGGVLQYVNGYEGQGPERFVGRLAELEEAYGQRFAAPPLLIDQVASGRLFMDEGRTAAAA